MGVKVRLAAGMGLHVDMTTQLIVNLLLFVGLLLSWQCVCVCVCVCVCDLMRADVKRCCCAVSVISSSTDVDIPACGPTASVTDVLDSVPRSALLLLPIYFSQYLVLSVAW